MKPQHLAAVVLSFLLWSFPAAALPSGGQQAHNVEEWELVQKFKVANASFEKAKAFYNKQKFVEAEKMLAECLGIMPEHNEAHHMTAQIAYRNNDLSSALEHMEKAREYFALTVKILAKQQQDRMFEIQKAVEQNEDNINQLKQSMSRATTNEERSDLQRKISEQERQLAIARDRLKNPIPLIDKMPAEYSYFHGNILFRLKRIPEAEEKYLEAIQADPLHTPATNNLINIYYLTRRYDAALESIERAEKNNLKINEELKKAVLKAAGKKP